MFDSEPTVTPFSGDADHDVTRRSALVGGGAAMAVALGMAADAPAAGAATRRLRKTVGGGGQLAMQLAGRGRLEEHPPESVDNARFEGRFGIFGISGPSGPLFGADVSLHSADVVSSKGRGMQSAHFTGVRSGIVLEGFSTNDGSTPGFTLGRTSLQTRVRIYFDAQPDGSRAFTNRDSFTRGQLIATYQAEEFFQIDPRAGTFFTRVNYTLLESKPFRFRGKRANLAALGTRLSELSHGHNPETLAAPEPIPLDVTPFNAKGAGSFAQQFVVSGTVLSAG